MTELVTLAECPIGLFMAGDELCLKTEYGSNEGRIDAYIVSSGEFFWGTQPQSIENQRKNMVRPIDAEALLAAAKREREQCRLLQQALDAINSARSEPLYIMRDSIRNWLEDNPPLIDKETGRG